MKQKRKRMPNFTFALVGIREGEIIDFIRDDVFLYKKGEMFTVAGSGLEVMYHATGEVATLREWTMQLLTQAGKPPKKDRLEPKRHWEHKGIRLTELYSQWKHDNHPIKA